MKVYQLLRKKSNWTQGANARSKCGHPTYPQSPTAICWCINGAINKCYPCDEWRKVLTKLKSAVNYEDITVFNDTRTHAEVLAACRRAGI